MSIFPDIPRFPEEPKSEGAPKRAHESILLAEEEGLPFLYEIGEDLKKFKDLEVAEKQKQFQAELAQKLLKDPQKFEEYFDNIRILEEKWIDKKTILAYYKNSFFNNLERFAGEYGENDVDLLKAWLNLSVKSNVYKEASESVLRGYHDRLKSVKESMNFLYSFAQAVMESDDEEVFKRGLEIVGWGTDIFPQKSLSEKNYVKSIFSGDDELLRQQLEIDAVTWYFLQKFFPEKHLQMQKSIGEIVKLPETQKAASEFTKRQPARMKILSDFYNDIDIKSGLSPVDPEKLKEWPYDLIMNGGPLRKLFNERVSLEGNQVALFLPNKGDSLFSYGSNVNEIILGDLKSEPSPNKRTIKDRNIVGTIFYLSPELKEEELGLLERDNVNLKKEIISERVHFVSPRGDKVIITDEELAGLGIRSILFELGNSRTMTDITIEIENYKFELTLDRNFVLLDKDGRRRLPISFKRGAFVESVILNYLKEILCTGNVEVGENAISLDQSAEAEKEFNGRRAHLRKLPAGMGYTEKQRLVALQEQDDLDLGRLNAELGLTRETGQKTFVKAVEGGEEPMILRAPRAMDRYKKLLDKNTI